MVFISAYMWVGKKKSLVVSNGFVVNTLYIIYLEPKTERSEETWSRFSFCRCERQRLWELTEIISIHIDCISYVFCLSGFVVFAILYGLLSSTITISPWPESQIFIQKWWHCLFFVLKYLDIIWYINEWFSSSGTLASFLAGLGQKSNVFCSSHKLVLTNYQCKIQG